MKPQRLVIVLVGALAGACTLAAAEPAAAATTPAAGPKVGVYDSRMVAFAHFWDAGAFAQHEKQMQELRAAAKAAEAAGDQARLAQIKATGKAGQTQAHLQVFSTAPCTEALAALKDRLPAICQEAGVAELVSKWDEAALAKYPESARVDVTDLLTREFKIPEARAKVLEKIRTAPPVPLDEARRLDAEGKM